MTVKVDSDEPTSQSSVSGERSHAGSKTSETGYRRAIFQREKNVSLESMFNAVGAAVKHVPLAILAASFLAFLLLMTVLSYRYFSISSSYYYTVNLVFPGRDQEKYPNGSPFNLADILAPAVVSEVFTENEISKFDLGLSDFQDQFSIAPFAVNLDYIQSKYEPVLKNRGIEAAELQLTQQRMELEITKSSQRAVQLQYLNKGGKLPPNVVQKVLIDMVSTWSESAVDARGVLRSDIQSVRPESFNISSLESLSKLNMLRGIRRHINDVSDYLRKISGLPGGDAIIDNETGLNIRGLEAKLNGVEANFRELPAGWSSDVNEVGKSVQTPVGLYTSKVFSEESFSDLDYMISLDLIGEKIELLRKNISKIGDEPFGTTVSDPVSGLTILDLSTLIDEHETYRLDQMRSPTRELGIAKKPELTALYYNARIKELERKRNLLQTKAKVAENVSKELETSIGGSERGSNGSGLGSSSGSTVIPQLGDDFIDRLLELGSRGAETEFKQQLMSKSISLQDQYLDIDSELSRIRDYLQRLNTSPAEQVRDEISQEFIGQLKKEIPDLSAALAKFAGMTERIAKRLRYANEVHSIIEDKEVKVTMVDHYLRDVQSDDGLMAIIGKDLQVIGQAAVRINELLDSKTTGKSNSLYVPVTGVEQVQIPLIGLASWLFIGMVWLLGFLLVLAYSIFKDLYENRITGPKQTT